MSDANTALFAQGKWDCYAGLPPQLKDAAYLEGYLSQVHELPEVDGLVQYPSIAVLESKWESAA